jgi:hypothetical protein
MYLTIQNWWIYRQTIIVVNFVGLFFKALVEKLVGISWLAISGLE